MTQFEEENDFGRGGGEVDDETMEEAWENADELAGVDHETEDEP